MPDRPPVPITRPYFGPEDFEAIRQPLESGWVVQGPHVAEFERRFGAFVGAPYAAATTSCTTALHLAMVALGAGPGDEVIVPAFTWVATPNAVEFVGARPVFCDIDLATFNVDPGDIEALTTPRTVGIIPVHLFGLCADMPAVNRVAAKHGLWVVEDAACGFGARLRGRHAGTFGDIGCFSFHPRKAITTGEGGMVTTSRVEIHRLVGSLRDHGATRTDLERHHAANGFLLPDYPRVGFNFRMTDIQGALGCAQLARADWVLAERRRVAAAYDKELVELDQLMLPVVPDGYDHGYQSYVCLFRPEPPRLENVHRLHGQRNMLMATLEASGIATRQGTHAAALTTYYREKYKIQPAQFPNAYLADQLSLSLPIFPGMTEAEQHAVVSGLAA